MKKGRNITLWQIGFLILVIGFVTHLHATSAVKSEAVFADYTESGLAVVPASGVSEASYVDPCPYPIEGGWDAYGRILYANYTQRRLAANGYSVCLNNNTSNVFFVPVGSAGETASFINAAPGLNISVY